MVNFLQLPAYNPGNALDFSQVNNAIDTYQKQNQLNQQNKLQQAHLGLAQNADRRAQVQSDAQSEDRRRQQAGALAQMGLAEKDPVRRMNILKRMNSLHADASSLPPEYHNPDTAFDLVVREAQGFESEKDRAQLGLIKGQTAAAYAQAQRARMGGETPANIREWQSFQQMTPEQQRQYLTMKRADRYYDVGTGYARPDSINPAGPPVAVLPKDVVGAAEAKAVGTSAGQAKVDLPKVQQNAATTMRYVDDVLKDPNLDNVTGWQARLPTVRSASVDTEERIGQLGGRAFLSAFESLKGGGQITEIEGKKATDALARITNLKQSDAGFKQALEDFKREVRNLVVIAERRAQAGSQSRSPDGGNAPDPLGIR